jgi:hypothetical protein
MVNASAILERPRVRIPVKLIPLDLVSVVSVVSVPVAPGHDHAYDCAGCGCSPMACEAGCGHSCCCFGYTAASDDCPTCFGVGKIFAKPGEVVPCPTCS